MAYIKAVLWRQGYIVDQNPDRATLGHISLGKRVGGQEGDNPPCACLLVTTPNNTQADNLLQRVHEENYANEVFCEQGLGDHPAPWLRLRAQRAAGPPQHRSFHQDKLQDTLGRTRGCKCTIGLALNRCRVLFPAAGTVANHHRLLLGAAQGKAQTRCVFNIEDEASIFQ